MNASGSGLSSLGLAIVGYDAAELNAVKAWLADQVLSNEHAKLGQGGHTNTQIPLQDVFIDLPVSDSSEESEYEDRVLFLRGLLSSESRDLSELSRRIDPSTEDVSDRLASSETIDVACGGGSPGWSSVLLIGGPGQGKSTLGQLACQIFRAKLLYPYSEDLDARQCQIVRAVMSGEDNKAHRASFDVRVPEGDSLPLQISLPDYVAWAASAQEEQGLTFLDFIVALPGARASGIDRGSIEKMFSKIPVFLVLDGFDEVGSRQDRSRIVAAARQLLTEISHNGGRAKILATTRPQGYADELSRIGISLQKLYLSPLQRAEALGYAVKLIQAKVHGHDAIQKAISQITEAADEPATERLLSTPLQVTILTALIQQVGRAPRERWNLFSRYFTYTFDREVERGTYASKILSEYRHQIETVHARVALILQVEAELSGGSSARMTRSRFKDVIGSVLAEDEICGDGSLDLVSDIAIAAENRLVFLVEPEPDKFGFEIRSLQEFMAAKALSTGRESEVESRLKVVAKAPMFRNVVLFMASRIYSEASPLREVFSDVICKGLDEDSSDPVTRVAASGARLALEALEEGAALSQPKRAKILVDRASKLLSVPASIEHVRLARVVDDQIVSPLISAIDRVLSRGSDISGLSKDSAWVIIFDGLNRDEGWARELAGRYVSPEQPSRSAIVAFHHLGLSIGQWVAADLEKRLGQLGPALYVSLNFSKPRSEAWGSWMGWIASAFKSRARVRRMKFGVRFIGEETSDWNQQVPQYPLPGGNSWRAWRSVVDFELSPSSLSLANALRAIAADGGISGWRRLEWSASWPLSSCVLHANEKSGLLSLADAAERGALGSTREWLDAQKNWVRQDVAVQASLIGQGLPWTVEALDRSPPFLSVPSWRVLDLSSELADDGREPLLASSIGALARTQSCVELERLSEICLDAWIRLRRWEVESLDTAMVWAVRGRLSAAIVISHCQALGGELMLKFLSAIDLSDCDDTYVPIEIALSALRLAPSDSRVLRIVVSSLSNIPSGAYFDPDTVDANLKQIVGGARSDDGRCCDSSVHFSIVEVLLNIVLPGEEDGIVDRVMADKDAVHLRMALLCALRNGGVDAATEERMVIRMYARAKDDGVYSSEMMGRIIELTQQRMSGLEERFNWARLALPEPSPQSGRDERFPVSHSLVDIPVHLQKIELENVRGVESIVMELPAPEDATSGQWAIIIGANGTGKTTILRSLCVALRSVRNPAIWPKGAFGEGWQRIGGHAEAVVHDSVISLRIGRGQEIKTVLSADERVGVYQIPEQRRSSVFPLFAYGCRRGSALGGASREVDFGPSGGPEIATLFDDGADLIQAETWLVSLEGDTGRNESSSVVFAAVTTALCELLAVESVEVRSQRVWVTESGQPSVPLSCMSDGYLTCSGWFLDLIARWVHLAGEAAIEIDSGFMSRMSGLVLIDEIDLHLHPKWQIDIVTRTRKLLPKMSFIVTTHNPVTLVGASAREIWILEKSCGVTSAATGGGEPMTLTGGQIYQRYFGMSDLYPNDIGRKVKRYSYLSGYDLRNDEEEVEVYALREDLKAVGMDPGWEIVDRRVRG